MVAILGNFSLYHIYLYFTVQRLKSTDLIVKHLTLANTSIVHSEGVPQTMAAFELNYLFNDLRCKLVSYPQSVQQSAFGVYTGHHGQSQELQMDSAQSSQAHWALQQLCWTMQVFFNVSFPIYMSGKWSHRNATKQKDLVYSFSLPLPLLFFFFFLKHIQETNTWNDLF